jgi:hypothetical protein
VTKKIIENETKVEKQRRLIKSIEKKLNSSAEVGAKMEMALLAELAPKKIEEFFQIEDLGSVELSNIQIVAFSRMVKAEQRLEFLKHAFMEVLVELSQLKEAIEQKQRGGPNSKVQQDVTAKVFAKVGFRNKSMPKKEEFAKELQLHLTGSSGTDADGKYVVSDKTIDNYMKQLKLMLTEIYLKSQKTN